MVTASAAQASRRPDTVTQPPHPADEWVSLLYDELRTLARAHLRRERTGHTLSTTGLVNETWLRLAQQHSLARLDRPQFFNAAAAMMRRILVDLARARIRAKRGGGAQRVALDEVAEFLTVEEAEEVVALHDAVDRLRTVSPRSAEVVTCRFFAGFSLEETAATLEVSVKTVQRDWLTARAWLRKELARDLGQAPG